jgi:hypothetical protein
VRVRETINSEQISLWCFTQDCSYASYNVGFNLITSCRNWRSIEGIGKLR